MPKFAHADVLDNGPAHIKANATKMLLISTYVAGDSYATVVANKLSEATMAPGDFTLGSSGNNRTLTSATKSAAATATIGAGSNLHLAFTDGSGKVLWVTDETSDQAITSGNQIDFPALVYTANQPT